MNTIAERYKIKFLLKVNIKKMIKKTIYKIIELDSKPNNVNVKLTKEKSFPCNKNIENKRVVTNKFNLKNREKLIFFNKYPYLKFFLSDH